jgi:glycerophosphoryl diester phosphodiesterase
LKNEEKIYNLLKKYKGEYAIESFNPYVLEWFKKNAPEIWRGQLACRFTGETMSLIKKFILSRMYLNKKVSEPHFIAYKHNEIPRICSTKYKHLPLITWTIRSQHEYMNVVKKCDNIIFEGFIPKI